MKKNYHSLHVGMLYVTDTREQYLYLYCHGLLFIFLYLFVNLWTKEGFLAPCAPWVPGSEGRCSVCSYPFLLLESEC